MATLADVSFQGLPMPKIAVHTYKKASDMEYYMEENAKRGWIPINTQVVKHSHPCLLIILTGFLCFFFQPPTDYIVTYRWMPDTLVIRPFVDESVR